MASQLSTFSEEGEDADFAASTPSSIYSNGQGEGSVGDEVIGFATSDRRDREPESSSRAESHNSATDVGSTGFDYEEVNPSQTAPTTHMTPSVMGSTESENYTVVPPLPMIHQLNLLLRHDGFTHEEIDALWPHCTLCTRRFSIHLVDPLGHRCPEISANHAEITSPLDEAQHRVPHVLFSPEGCEVDDFGALFTSCNECNCISLKGYEEDHQCTNGMYDLVR